MAILSFTGRKTVKVQRNKSVANIHAVPAKMPFCGYSLNFSEVNSPTKTQRTQRTQRNFN